MNTKRPRTLDLQKSVNRVYSTAEFQALQGVEIDSQMQLEQQQSKKEKENIQVPQVITLQNEINRIFQNKQGELVEKKVKKLLGYIRIRREEVLPRPDLLELSEVQYKFWQEFVTQREENRVITKECFEDFLTRVDQGSGKDQILGFQDLQKEFPAQVRSLCEDTQKQLYFFWRSQREIEKKGLLRIFWRTPIDYANPHAAFRPRDKEKMKLRRQTKQNDEEMYRKFLQLREEQKSSHILLSQIRAREYLKYELTNQKFLYFVREVGKIDKGVKFEIDAHTRADSNTKEQEFDFYYKLNLAPKGTMLPSASILTQEVQKEFQKIKVKIDASQPELESEEIQNQNGNGTENRNQAPNTKKLNIFAPTGDHKKNFLKNPATTNQEMVNSAADKNTNTSQNKINNQNNTEDNYNPNFDLTSFLLYLAVQVGQQNIKVDDLFEPKSLNEKARNKGTQPTKEFKQNTEISQRIQPSNSSKQDNFTINIENLTINNKNLLPLTGNTNNGNVISTGNSNQKTNSAQIMSSLKIQNPTEIIGNGLEIFHAPRENVQPENKFSLPVNLQINENHQIIHNSYTLPERPVAIEEPPKNQFNITWRKRLGRGNRIVVDRMINIQEENGNIYPQQQQYKSKSETKKEQQKENIKNQTFSNDIHGKDYFQFKIKKLQMYSVYYDEHEEQEDIDLKNIRKDIKMQVQELQKRKSLQQSFIKRF